MISFTKSLTVFAILASTIGPIQAQAISESISIVAAMQVATDRFRGRVIAADLIENSKGESISIYSLRLLTPDGDVIEVRVDAAEGRIIEVNGRGLVQARKTL